MLKQQLDRVKRSLVSRRLYLPKLERNYQPRNLGKPARMLPIVSAWKGLEGLVPDIMERFHLGNDRCLEFGVEYGYSTVVFSNYFKQVTGVDTFEGDEHSKVKACHYEKTAESLKPYPNIELIRSNYQDFTARCNDRFDLIHVDIVHTYEHTYRCGLWSAQHSKCTLFHDTESFFDVKMAVVDIARATGKRFYNFRQCYGLGIVV
jgi:hypothetical protein